MLDERLIALNMAISTKDVKTYSRLKDIMREYPEEQEQYRFSDSDISHQSEADNNEFWEDMHQQKVLNF